MSFTLESEEVQLLKIIAERLGDLNSKVELQNIRLTEKLNSLSENLPVFPRFENKKSQEISFSKKELIDSKRPKS